MIRKLQSLQGGVVIDRRDGYNLLVDLYENMTGFKECIKLMTNRAERTYKKVSSSKMKKQDFDTDDLEV